MTLEITDWCMKSWVFILTFPLAATSGNYLNLLFWLCHTELTSLLGWCVNPPPLSPIWLSVFTLGDSYFYMEAQLEAQIPETLSWVCARMTLIYQNPSKADCSPNCGTTQLKTGSPLSRQSFPRGWVTGCFLPQDWHWASYVSNLLTHPGGCGMILFLPRCLFLVVLLTSSAWYCRKYPHFQDPLPPSV